MSVNIIKKNSITKKVLCISMLYIWCLRVRRIVFTKGDKRSPSMAIERRRKRKGKTIIYK